MKFRRPFCRFAAILIISDSLLVYSARADNARDIAKKAFSSVVMLVMEDNTGQPFSLGSGFFVKESVVATNLHVVAGAVKGYAKIVGQKTKYDISGFVAIDEQRDLVLLWVKEANRLLRLGDINKKKPRLVLDEPNATVLSLGDSNKVSVGDEIFVVGNPQGLEGTFSKGIVSAIRTMEKDSILQITAPISPGSSGGPVLNEEGKVIGVAVATFKGGQNLNFAIPASYLSTLLADTKPLRPLKGEKDAEKKSKSILSDLGGRNTEGVVAEKLTWQNQVYGVDGNFSFTLRNQLRESVQDVYCLVIFYDKDDTPLDITVTQYRGIIPGMLAKRVNGSVDQSIKRLTTPASRVNPFLSSFIPSTKVEFRILDFRIVEESEAVL